MAAQINAVAAKASREQVAEMMYAVRGKISTFTI